MHIFNLLAEQEWDPKRHVEKVLGEIGEGDVTVACWEPGQISPNHCHPDATEIYFCFQGGGKMRTPKETVDIVPGAFVVHPPANSMNTSTDRSAPCSSGCATARTCRAAISSGAATRSGRKNRGRRILPQAPAGMRTAPYPSIRTAPGGVGCPPPPPAASAAHRLRRM
jgi:Uncharacterized conserved protein, contains double-stranded beta-helix domain